MAVVGLPYVQVPGASRSEKHDATAFKVGIYQYENVQTAGSTTGAFSYPSATIGDKIILGERVFYYARAGTSANVYPGQYYQAQIAGAAGNANNANNAAPYVAAVAGSYTIQVTCSSNVTETNLWSGGWMNIVNPAANTTVGTFRIYSTTPCANNAGTFYTTVTLFDPLPFAIPTTANVSLTQSKYDRPALGNNQTAAPCGVPLIYVPQSNNTANTATFDNYFWMQTWGPATVLANAVFVVGQNVGPGAESGKMANAANSAFIPILGRTMRVQGANNWALVDLTIAP